MIANLLAVPSWILTHENKPDKQAFQFILNNMTQSISLTVDTLSQPDLYHIEIRGSLEQFYNPIYNLIFFNNCYYKVKNYTLIQTYSDAKNIYNIEGEIDLFLSYVVDYFDEQNSSSNMVFFKQKHIARSVAINTTENSLNPNKNVPLINFEKQFWLTNKPQALENLGDKMLKISASATPSYWNQYKMVNTGAPYNLMSVPVIVGEGELNKGAQSGSADIGGQPPMPPSSFAYILWKMSSNEISQPSAWFVNTYGLVNYIGNGNILSGGDKPWYNYFIFWWYLLQSVGSDAYLDIITLPLPLECGVNLTEGGRNGLQNTTLGDYAPNTFQSSTSNQVENCWTWLVNNNRVGFIFNPTLLWNNTGTTFNEIQNAIDFAVTIEPALINFFKFRVRGCGEDSFVDMCGFNNFNGATFMRSTFSFSLNINHPITQLTNIPTATLAQYYGDGPNDGLEYLAIPYAYSRIADAIYCLNWKSTLPSLSNNWNNYYLNNMNQYHMGLNISHLQLQNHQAQVASTTMDSIGNIVGAIFDPFEWGHAISSAISGESSASTGEMEAQQQYNYMSNGKKQDMSRVSNERVANNSNPFSVNANLLTFILEKPVQYEYIAIVNYFALNGYIVNRWEPFNYWYNRVLCNYVKIDYFSDCLIPNLIEPYKRTITQMLNTGLRLWTLNYVQNKLYANKKIALDLTDAIFQDYEQTTGPGNAFSGVVYPNHEATNPYQSNTTANNEVYFLSLGDSQNYSGIYDPNNPNYSNLIEKK